jgi:hypothetical protein
MSTFPIYHFPAGWRFAHRAALIVLALAMGSQLRAEGSGFVLVNLLPVAEEMELTVNGSSLGKMRSGAATGPLPLRSGRNSVTLSWGEDNRAEGLVEAKAGVTSIVAVYPERAPSGDEPEDGKSAVYAFRELPSGVRVQQPQFALFSGLPKPANLAIDGQPVTVDPYAGKKVGGNSGRIKVAQGEETLLDLDANPPACLDGPMRWYLFAVGDTETDSVKIVPVPDFKYEW